MKYLNIVVEGGSEEIFVKDVLKNHFASFEIFISVRRIRTGWDSINNKPAKGGLIKYIKFRNDVMNWIKSDKNREMTWYKSMIDLYAFPKDDLSPYKTSIQSIIDPYRKIELLEDAIRKDIDHPQFIPYVQLHEFETFILVNPDKLITMYPDGQRAIDSIKKDIGSMEPERVNEFQDTAPSKRIIKHLPDYKGEKAQVGPLIAEDIGLTELRTKCPHFNNWITTLENI